MKFLLLFLFFEIVLLDIRQNSCHHISDWGCQFFKWICGIRKIGSGSAKSIFIDLVPAQVQCFIKMVRQIFRLGLLKSNLFGSV